MENNYNNIFDEILKNLNKSGNIYNETYINNLIEKWKDKDLHYEKNNVTKNEEINNELDNLINIILKSSQDNLIHLIISKNIEMGEAIKDEYCSNQLIIYKLSIAIFKYLYKKTEIFTPEKIIFFNLLCSLIDNLTGLLFSYMYNDFLTVMQKFRMVYECFVTIQFIDKYKELVEPFKKHIEYIEDRILGKDTKIKDYEWAKSVFPKEKIIKLKMLAKDVGIDEQMNTLYQLSTNYIHINAYSAFHKKPLDKEYIKKYIPTITSLFLIHMNILVKNVSVDKKLNDFIAQLFFELIKNIHVKCDMEKILGSEKFNELMNFNIQTT